jgi:hypothetical protein
VHGLPSRPSFEAVVDGYPRQVWVNETGDEIIESYTIPAMAHGTPLATGKADNQCGAAGPFLLEVGFLRLTILLVFSVLRALPLLSKRRMGISSRFGRRAGICDVGRGRCDELPGQFFADKDRNAIKRRFDEVHASLWHLGPARDRIKRRGGTTVTAACRRQTIPLHCRR